MDAGLLALIGIFACAGLCGVWRWQHGKSVERRVAALGFEACDAEAPSLEAAWRAVSGCAPSHETCAIRTRSYAGP